MCSLNITHNQQLALR